MRTQKSNYEQRSSTYIQVGSARVMALHFFAFQAL